MSAVKKSADNGIGKGTPGPGRPKGAVNKSTASVKAALEATFDQLGGVTAMVVWAREQPTEFYKLYAKLLPAEMTVKHTGLEKIAELLDGLPDD